MKRIYITTISNQRTLTKCHYETGQKSLKYDRETAYPIIHLMNNSIEAGDDVDVVVINFPDNPEANYEMLKKEIAEIEQRFDISVTVKEISHGLEETKTEHINLFKELLCKIEDCSKIYADLTYGTKPTPMVIAFALYWIEMIRKYSTVEHLVYGRIFWKEASVIEKACIYDVTEILKIVNLSQKIGEMGGDNVEKAIFEILNIGEGM